MQKTEAHAHKNTQAHTQAHAQGDTQEYAHECGHEQTHECGHEQTHLQTPLCLAQHYLDASKDMRSELGIAQSEKLVAVPIAQGEHNANFTFEHPSSGKKLVLRVNYESQLGLDKQVSYEACALRALESSGRTAHVLFVDDSKHLINHGVLVTEFFEGSWLNFHNPAHVHEAARILADVHSVVPCSGCGLIQADNPLRSQFDTCVGFFERYSASSLADSLVVEYLERFIQCVEEVLDIPVAAADKNHIQNTEAVPSHFLIPRAADSCSLEAKTPEAKGSKSKTPEAKGHMVDWEKPVIGEVAQDIAYFMSPTTTIWDTDYLFDATARQTFIDAYWRAVDGRFSRGSFDERYEAYVMSNALLGVSWSCNALIDYAGNNKALKNQKTANLLGVYVSEDFLKRVWRDCFERKGH